MTGELKLLPVEKGIEDLRTQDTVDSFLFKTYFSENVLFIYLFFPTPLQQLQTVDQFVTHRYVKLNCIELLVCHPSGKLLSTTLKVK